MYERQPCYDVELVLIGREGAVDLRHVRASGHEWFQIGPRRRLGDVVHDLSEVMVGENVDRAVPVLGCLEVPHDVVDVHLELLQHSLDLDVGVLVEQLFYFFYHLMPRHFGLLPNFVGSFMPQNSVYLLLKTEEHKLNPRRIEQKSLSSQYVQN